MTAHEQPDNVDNNLRQKLVTETTESNTRAHVVNENETRDQCDHNDHKVLRHRFVRQVQKKNVQK